MITVLTDHHKKVEVTAQVKNQHATYMLNTRPVKVRLHIKECPRGFNFSVPSTEPRCIDELYAKGFNRCDVHENKAYIERRAPKWLGYYTSPKDPNISGFIAYDRCPLDYCIGGPTVNISTNSTHFSQDEQCAHNRSGILCGQCQPGLSIGLGPLTCINCTHNATFKLIAWSVAFPILGLLMVMVLLFMDLTITQGTMSELLFYANTFFIYKASLLYANVPDDGISYQQLLDLSINIINLNFWHNACFFNGLTLTGRTWLQFLLVVYLWLITSGIVLLCRKSAWVSSRIGPKAVPVLATILLLSFSPLNLSILYSLTFASIKFPDSSSMQLVMLFDGNVPYFRGKHVPLFIAGCVFALLSFGLTITLLCVQPLQRYSHLKVFRWANTLKPLFDAYTCPHIIKPHCRFWNGFLLLVRMSLYVCFIVATEYVHFIIGVLCVLVLAVGWASGGVYTKHHLNVLSSFYIMNIGVLSIATHFMCTSTKYSSQPAQEQHYRAVTTIGSSISTSVALAVLLATIACHTIAQLRRSNCHALGSARRICQASMRRIRGPSVRPLREYVVASSDSEE